MGHSAWGKMIQFWIFDFGLRIDKAKKLAEFMRYVLYALY
jgi:hypothetical protein